MISTFGADYMAGVTRIGRAHERVGLEPRGYIGGYCFTMNTLIEIAVQTNLLALNATIAAARAGDAGKGFTVVAGEVQRLANQTAKATEEISSHVSGVQSATRDAAEAIRSIGGTIGTLNEIASVIAAAVEQQGAATGDTGRTAGQVQQAAGNLNSQSDRLSREVQGFVARIRTG